MCAYVCVYVPNMRSHREPGQSTVCSLCLLNDQKVYVQLSTLLFTAVERFEEHDARPITAHGVCVCVCALQLFVFAKLNHSIFHSNEHTINILIIIIGYFVVSQVAHEICCTHCKSCAAVSYLLNSTNTSITSNRRQQ